MGVVGVLGVSLASLASMLSPAASPPEAIGQRSGQQQQRGHCEEITRQGPLQRRDARAQAASDRRHGHLDHVGVEGGDHRGENRGCDQRGAGRAAQRDEGAVLGFLA